MMRKTAAAAVMSMALVFAVAEPVSASNPLPAPFSWSGYSWCPTYQAQYGCDTIQSPAQYTVSFDPAQVRQATNGTNDILLLMNSTSTKSGAFNSRVNETWTPPVTFQETIYLPCNSLNQIENWAAFWMDGTVGSWPAHGEIDVAEGLRGVVKSAYHYLNSSGQNAQVQFAPAGNFCGWHTYKVHWTSSTITFYYDGAQIGQLAKSCSSPCKSIGVPIATDPMYVLNDYGAGSNGGPTTPSVIMHIHGFLAVKG
jgi:hypothetical protein